MRYLTIIFMLVSFSAFSQVEEIEAKKEALRLKMENAEGEELDKLITQEIELDEELNKAIMEDIKKTLEAENDAIKRFADSLEKVTKAQFDSILSQAEKEIKEAEKPKEYPKEDPEDPKDSDLLTKFKSFHKDGLSVSNISKKFKESELISIGKELGYSWTFKGSKSQKVKLIIEKL